MVDIDRLKEEILRVVNSEGPLLPVQISRKLDKDTIFAGAVLSELVNQKKVRITYAKIGGSPMYYVDGQERKLDVLYKYLSGKEREAYDILSGHQVLRDNGLEPAIRVALRNLKDFAFPFEVNGEVYWRWYLTSEGSANEMIKETKPKVVKDVKVKEKKLVVDKGEEFFDLVNNYLKEKNINVFGMEVVRKNREVEGRVKINSDLGVLEYWLLAKNKKRLNEADLSLASDKGRKSKRPVLFLSNGDLSKKAEKYLEDNLKGRIIFRKI